VSLSMGSEHGGGAGLCDTRLLIRGESGPLSSSSYHHQGAAAAAAAAAYQHYNKPTGGYPRTKHSCTTTTTTRESKFSSRPAYTKLKNSQSQSRPRNKHTQNEQQQQQQQQQALPSLPPFPIPIRKLAKPAAATPLLRNLVAGRQPVCTVGLD